MVRRIVKKFVKKHPEYRYLVVYLEVALLMMQHNRSYRGMVDDLSHDKAMRKKLGFSHTPSKSCLWWNDPYDMPPAPQNRSAHTLQILSVVECEEASDRHPGRAADTHIWKGSSEDTVG